MFTGRKSQFAAWKIGRLIRSASSCARTNLQVMQGVPDKIEMRTTTRTWGYACGFRPLEEFLRERIMRLHWWSGVVICISFICFHLLGVVPAIKKANFLQARRPFHIRTFPTSGNRVFGLRTAFSSEIRYFLVAEGVLLTWYRILTARRSPLLWRWSNFSIGRWEYSGVFAQDGKKVIACLEIWRHRCLHART